LFLSLYGSVLTSILIIPIYFDIGSTKNIIAREQKNREQAGTLGHPSELQMIKTLGFVGLRPNPLRVGFHGWRPPRPASIASDAQHHHGQNQPKAPGTPTLSCIVPKEEDQTVLGRYLQHHWNLPHSLLQRLVRQKKIYLTLDNQAKHRVKDLRQRVPASSRIDILSSVEVGAQGRSTSVLPAVASTWKPEVVYEDEEVIAVNKPKEMSVHGALTFFFFLDFAGVHNGVSSYMIVGNPSCKSRAAVIPPSRGSKRNAEDDQRKLTSKGLVDRWLGKFRA
jgi:hypothetical protein